MDGDWEERVKSDGAHFQTWMVVELFFEVTSVRGLNI
jgi:hypothetical protein